MGFRATMYGSQKNHYPWLKCHKHEEKIDNDYVLRNDHRIKSTQPISIILVSFFSEDNYLVKSKYAIFFNIKVTKIERSTFFGYPLYVYFKSRSIITIHKKLLRIHFRWCRLKLNVNSYPLNFREQKVSAILVYLIPRGARASVRKSLKIIWNAWKRGAFHCIKSLKMGFCEEQINLKSD